MEIKFRDIILRDMTESDIDDWIRWYTVETEWGEWDAPDEPLEPIDPDAYRTQMQEMLSKPTEGVRSFFELDTADGTHIGMVASYIINEKWEWIPWSERSSAQKVYHTLGIEICDSRFWNRRLGRQAVAAFANYFLDNGIREICLQTWSGNFRMIRAAERIGFVECNRIPGNRQIRGGIYDSLTFQLDLDKFDHFLQENP